MCGCDLFLPRRSQGLSLGCQTWLQVRLSTDYLPIEPHLPSPLTPAFCLGFIFKANEVLFTLN